MWKQINLQFVNRTSLKIMEHSYILNPQSIYCLKILLTAIKVSSINSDPDFLNVRFIII